jgi:uncharacterized membrane protein YbjE (DUF340 family)
MKNSVIIVVLFCVGVVLGYLTSGSELQIPEGTTSYALYVFLFFVGISIGIDLKIFRVVKKLHYKILLVPVSAAAGSLLGVGVLSFFMSDLSLMDCLAVGSGVGYYSLTSLMITEVKGEYLGVIALLTNIFREIITLVGTPLLIRYFGKLAPIASGGATSMDITLPVIIHYTGKDYAVISIFSGTVLSILVPFWVKFFL